MITGLGWSSNRPNPVFTKPSRDIPRANSLTVTSHAQAHIGQQYCVESGPLTISGDPWSLSGQNFQILVEKLGTNPDKNGPKCPKGQIDYPDRKTGKSYSMSRNPDKIWQGAGASGLSHLTLHFFNAGSMCLLNVDFRCASRLSNVDICLLKYIL